MLARATTHALVGLDPRQVEIEAHLRGGLKAFTIVGLADRAVQEAKGRVVSAGRPPGLFGPAGRVIVNLAPAELRKEGSAFDLPIALAVLAASGQVPRARLAEHASIGELALDGRIRRVGGVLAVAEGARRAGLTEILSVAVLLDPEHPLVVEPPFRAPHHSASTAAIVGGGPRLRPGEASLAHHGVLLIDELAEFQRPALEALRQPLEDGVISVARAAGNARFPARFQLVGTMNLCPCGARGDPNLQCTCSAQRLARYRDKLSRALLDPFDLLLTGPRPRAVELQGGPGEESAVVRERVRAARERLRRPPRRTKDADELLTRAVDRLPLSGRGRARVARVAQTIAALAGSNDVLPEHVAEALSYRRPAELRR